MYSGSGFKDSELGDIDIIKVDKLYHLFHLVLPNHDYIAHAVSSDGFSWKRVSNALFIGDPGEWDDDMLWTMHISENPDVPGSWRMFYTGLSRREKGRVQRIGLARSNDLYYWEKATFSDYPLVLNSPHYEESISEGRHWVSCRDPFFYKEGDQRYLLVNARVPYGPVVRRGCIAVAQEVKPDVFEWLPPLFFPRMYDDVEVPSVYKIQDRYYLIGNLREDVKVHYWYAKELFGEYEAFYNNVLLPRGNYAARITRDGETYLVWSFYSPHPGGEGSRLLPPPKELVVNKDGHLELKSFSGFDQKVLQRKNHNALLPFRRVLKNPTAHLSNGIECSELKTTSGYEVFFFNHQALNFRLRVQIQMNGQGKTGFVFRSDSKANGYYVSLDLVSGLAQIRIWGHQKEGTVEESFEYENLQDNHFPISSHLLYDVEIICFGGYIELSVDNRVVLSLVDTMYMSSSDLGVYVESACIRLNNLCIEDLDGPLTEDYGPL
jgi:beta-fructofuranosidase